MRRGVGEIKPSELSELEGNLRLPSVDYSRDNLQGLLKGRIDTKFNCSSNTEEVVTS
jgi:hypothetical protein